MSKFPEIEPPSDAIPAALAERAATLPTQDVGKRRPAQPEDTELRVQIKFMARESVRNALSVAAVTNKVTVQTYILQALQNAGLPITEDDLRDRRRSE